MKDILIRNFVVLQLACVTFLLTVIFHIMSHKSISRHVKNTFINSHKRKTTQHYAMAQLRSSEVSDLDYSEDFVDVTNYKNNARLVPSKWALEYLKRLRNQITRINLPETPKGWLKQKRRRFLTFADMLENRSFWQLISTYISGAKVSITPKRASTIIYNLGTLLTAYVTNSTVSLAKSIGIFGSETLNRAKNIVLKFSGLFR